MSESTTAPFAYLVEEPPLSPSPAPPTTLRTSWLEPVPDPPAEPALVVPEPDPEPELDASAEEQLRCYGLLTSEQMAQALREGVVNHKSVMEIALENGWITPADLGREEPNQVTLITETEVALYLRLSNGERILVDRFESRDKAASEARQLSVRMGREHEWPLINDRCVRPEAVVSIDVERLS